MDKQNYLDISLLKNQNMIAVKLAENYSVEELEQINFSSIVLFESKRDISKPINIIYESEFAENRKIQLLDIFLLDAYPIIRFINLRILQSDYFQMDFKCKFNKKILNYLDIIVAKAVNFLKYKSKYDAKLIKNNIINNFASILANSMSLGGLEEIRFISEYVNADESILTQENFVFDFSIENVKFHVTANDSLIRFSFIANDKEEYIRVNRNKIGVSSISLIIEKAIKIKCKK